MTHQEANERCAKLNGELNRERQWFARETAPGDWEIISVAVLGMRPIKAVVESRPQQHQPDPRPSIMRNIPPYGPG